MKKTSWSAALCVTLLATAALEADTLIFRDGTRIEGDLVSVAGDTIEFRERRGRGRVLRVDRDELRSIELESGFDTDEPARPSRPSRPRGLREKDVLVSGDVPFVDTGIDVRPGQQIYFESTGNVWWKPSEKTGPEGESGSDRERDSRRPLPRRPTGGLLGKVGQDSTDLFFIGADPGPIRVRSAGRLLLGVNDDYVQDNHGNFRVVVYY
jgi:hypothetical protein